MKKLLLFIVVFFILAATSCSKEEDSTPEVSQEEKELLVKQTLIEFNKSAIKTGKLKKFLNSLSQKSSAENISSSDVEALFQEFLGEQTQSFLDLYYQLEALNMTGEEFKSIADQYEYLKSDTESKLLKSSSSECNAGSLACSILDWLRYS